MSSVVRVKTPNFIPVDVPLTSVTIGLDTFTFTLVVSSLRGSPPNRDTQKTCKLLRTRPSRARSNAARSPVRVRIALRPNMGTDNDSSGVVDGTVEVGVTLKFHASVAFDNLPMEIALPLAVVQLLIEIQQMVGLDLLLGVV